ncbi:hypothetical protein CMI38_03130 [Candidatus Pacearchaeota archaeon]|jgi:hypothetical protein|nr:hypothetical protein [Candidatus Pacearchaeota archaeon]|tara:strand:+ start:59 stop:469 length:411 start_codon:yes stop_codon:yes gene_type:complete
MRIIGFNLTKILAERSENLKQNLQVNQNIDIKDVIKEDIPITKEEIIKIKFNLSVSYSDKSAKLEFNGNVLILPENNELKELLDSWKNKKLPEDARVPLFNFIMNKCNIKALYLEDELGLPLHVPLPKISFKQPEK